MSNLAKIVRGRGLNPKKPNNGLHEYLVTLQIKLEGESAEETVRMVDRTILSHTLFVDYEIKSKRVG